MVSLVEKRGGEPSRQLDTDIRMICHERRMVLVPVIEAASIGSDAAYMATTPPRELEMLKDPRHQDHNAAHVAQVQAVCREMLDNCGVVRLTETQFYSDHWLIRPIFDAARYHDQLQVIDQQKNGHGQAASLRYFFQMRDYRSSLQEGGKRRDSFLKIEKTAKAALLEILLRDPELNYLIHDANITLLNELLNRENWNDNVRRLVQRQLSKLYPPYKNYQKACLRAKLPIEKSAEWDAVATYLGSLGNLFITDKQVAATSTIIEPHGSPQGIVNYGIRPFSVRGAVASLKQELHLNPEDSDDVIFTKFSSLLVYKEQIQAFLSGEKTDNTVFTENEWNDIVKWTKLFTAADIYWTIYPGMISIFRTMITSSKLFGKTRPFFVMNRGKNGRHPLNEKKDYEKRAELLDKSGMPAQGIDDVGRWVAEFNFPFKDLCDNDPWLMNLIAIAFRIRLQAIGDYAIAIMNPREFDRVWKWYEDYQVHDLNLAVETGELGLQKKIVEIYERERITVMEIARIKKIGFTINSAGQRLPDSTRNPFLARIKRLLCLAKEKMEERYPIQDSEILKAQGYRTLRRPVPFLPILDHE